MTENKKLDSEKPTIIITGFLGAGKTTYLNHLLEKDRDTRFAIIENEYGKESIDSDLILSAEDDIIEINNGCLCCTLNDNLYEILNKLYQRRGEYDQLIIEATGMADPRGIAAIFLTNPAVKKQFPLKAVVCLIDAELVEDQLSETVEAIHQISYSDVLLINKTDLVSEKYVHSLRDKLRALNPLAKVISGKSGKFSTVDFSKSNFDNVINLSDTDVDNGRKSSSKFPISNREKGHHHHTHTDVVTITLEFHKVFDLHKLHLRLQAFLMFQSHGLYRMKGLIWVAQSDEQHLIQSVGNRLAIDKVSQTKTDIKKVSRIIMIGKELVREGLEKMFNQCI